MEISYWKEVSVPIRVLYYAPGKPDTRWDQGYGPDIEWEIDAPKEVADWLMAQMTDRDIEDIEQAIIEQSDQSRREARSFAKAVEAELSQWDARRADYAYDPLRGDK